MNMFNIANTKQDGMSLVELMVASTIGLFLIGGALVMYQTSRGTYLVNETYTRLQDNARFALDLMEPDVRLAGFWGLHNEPRAIEGRSDCTVDCLPADSVTDFIDSGDCSDGDIDGWMLALGSGVEAYNQDPAAGYFSWANTYCTNDFRDAIEDQLSDSFFVRHASETPVESGDLTAGVYYIRSDERPRSIVFQGAAEPVDFVTGATNHEIIFNGYYVRKHTFVPDDGIPSLRRVTLTSVGGTPAMEDREIISNVEAMQIELGIDHAPFDTSVDRYVDPDDDGAIDALSNGQARVLAIRVHLLLRSERTESDINDTGTYRLADKDIKLTEGYLDDVYGVDLNLDRNQRRRQLVTRTIFLRNANRSI